MSHRASLGRLAAEPLDLLIIGGGITGVGIARDAAMRGLRTALVERKDLGWGTSSRSSRLIHGGLRYLEQGQLRLVFESLRERRVLLRIAPHLVRPIPFVFPVHRTDRISFWRLAAGMWLYDLLASFRNVRAHRMLGKRRLLEAEPMIRQRGLTGGARYFDAQCDDARLVVATARSAIAHGALVANYMEAVTLERPGGRVSGAEVKDHLTGERALVRAAVVVNATGPWVDAVRRLEDPQAPPILRPTKGVHVLVARARIGHHDAITMTSPIDGRVMFVLPWGEHSYIGTTDTDTRESPDAVTASREDVVYLLRSANALFPSAHLTEADVLATWAGLRPLLSEGSGIAASKVSREHLIFEGPEGMLTIAGGKLTTFRVMAAQMVDRVGATLKEMNGRRIRSSAPTAEEPLPGGEAHDFEPVRARGLELGLTPATVEHLLRHYGTEAAAVYNLAREDRRLLTTLHPEHPAIEAEIVHVTRRELARTVEDVLVRRIHLYYETSDQGARAALRVSQLMARELGWDRDQAAAEAERYRAGLPARVVKGKPR